MKIDDVVREKILKADIASKGKTDIRGVTPAATEALLSEMQPMDDFSFPDLLQSFGKLLGQRQQLLENLPVSVRDFLPKTVNYSGTSSVPDTGGGAAAGGEKPPVLQQGVAALVRDNRMVLEQIRQLVAELETIDRLPELSGVTIADPEILKATLDKGLSNLQSSAVNVKNLTVPTASFALLVDEALQAGVVGEKLSGWAAAVTDALSEMAETPEASEKLAGWMNRVEPGVAMLAQTQNRPELVRVWAAVQEWGVAAASTPQGEIPLGSLLQKLAAEVGGARIDLLSLAQESVNSRAGRFELLVSTLSSQPGGIERLLRALPQVMAEVERMLPARTVDKKAGKGLDELARAAPKWLRDLSESTGKSGLIDFWAAAKAADVAPWLELSRTQRQQSAVNLKELAVTFEQPEIFRSPGDDSSSRGLMMQVALFGPGQEKPYPALIQIFEEKKDRQDGQPPEQEVWVRVALETENVGKVDLSFRLQDKKFLSVFTRFADSAAAVEFKELLPEIRRELAESSLELKKLSVSEHSQAGGTENG